MIITQKKPVEEVIIESPLNYIGSKAKVVEHIKKYYNSNSTVFFDVFEENIDDV